MAPTAGTSSETYLDSVPSFLQLPNPAKLRNLAVKAHNKVVAINNRDETEAGLWSTPEDCRETLTMWSQLIEIHSKADFTYVPDRLVALADVVNALADDVLGDYYRGMWYRPSPTGDTQDFVTKGEFAFYRNTTTTCCRRGHHERSPTKTLPRGIRAFPGGRPPHKLPRLASRPLFERLNLFG